jgi:hypothetical protein
MRDLTVLLWIGRLVLALLAGRALLLIYQTITYRPRVENHYRTLPDSQDISAQGLDPPAAAQPPITALLGMGFARLGEAQAQLPRARQPMTIWVFADPQRTTMADVSLTPGGSGEAFATMATVFQDEAYVFSGYRLAMGALYQPIEDDDLRAHYFADSLSAVYRHHCEQVALMAARHGEPMRYEDMDAYLRGEKLFKARYMRRQSAAPVRGVTRRLAALTGLAILDVALGAGLYALIADIHSLGRTLTGAWLGWIAATALTGLGIATAIASRRIIRDLPRARRRR